MADNRDVIETMIAAANRNDFDAQLACFSPDAEYRFDTYGIAARGREAIRQFVDQLIATFPDRRIVIRQIISDADRAAVEYHYVATSPGGIPGWPSAGEPFTSRLCSIYEFRDGLICAARDYVDRRVSNQS